VRALLLVTERRFDDDDDDAAASEMGELFSTTKAKVSLSLSLEHKTPNRARVREELLYSALRERRSLSLTSLFFFERARLREFTSFITLSFVRIQVVFLSSRLLGKVKLSVFCAFSSSFFILSFSSRVLVLALFLPALTGLFSKREDEKVESTDTQHPLLSLRLFLWENALLSIRFTQPHK